MSTDRNNRLVAGILILVGVVLLMSNFDIVNFNLTHYIFRWQTILVFVGLLIFIKNDNKNGIAMMAVGGVFLIIEIASNIYIGLFDLWPVGLMVIGGLIINQNKKKTSESHLEGDRYELNELALFGGNHIRVESKFRGGSIFAVFGGSTVDLRGCSLEDGNYDLNLFALFGGSKIIVPEGLQLNIEISPIIGDLVDKRRVKKEPTGDNCLNIRGTIIFGGGEIVN